MPIYKVSYVIPQIPRGGAILTQEDPPQVGDIITLDNRKYRVIEVVELLPPQRGIHFFHATIVPVSRGLT